jgi:sn-glycerol 3-phosphate transport system permease protein
MTSNHKTRTIITKSINSLIKLWVIILFLFPFYWMVITSFKTYNESILFPPTLWPKEFTWEAYQTLLEKTHLFGYLKNSLVITLSTIVIQILVMVPAAYAFSVYRFRGRNLLFSLVLVAFMIPTELTFITVYLLFAKWKLLGTLLPQILPFGANAFGIFLLRQAFMQIPKEIIESARLDNAGEAKIMFRLMLPMSKATVVTIALFSFVAHWNSYFWPLVMTDSENVRPLTIAIEKLKDVEYGINWNVIMAGNFVLIIPILLVFFFASKKIIAAFAYKGMK